jgi:hypothetical protein
VALVDGKKRARSAVGVKSKMKGRKLRSDINWQGTLKQKGVTQGLELV